MVIPSSEEAAGPLHAHSFNLTGLQPARRYEALVLARNKFGLSSPSKIVRFSTGKDTCELNTFILFFTTCSCIEKLVFSLFFLFVRILVKLRVGESSIPFEIYTKLASSLAYQEFSANFLSSRGDCVLLQKYYSKYHYAQKESIQVFINFQVLLLAKVYS